MTDVLLGVGLCLAASFASVLMFVIGAGLGCRSRWEAGYLEGQRVAERRPYRKQSSVKQSEGAGSR